MLSMKRFPLFLVALFFSIPVFCQVQAPAPASEAEKQQVSQLLQAYEKSLQQIAGPNVPTPQRNAAKRELLTLVEDKAIIVANDLDSVANYAPIMIYQYVQDGLGKQFPAGLTTSLMMDKILFGPVKHDKVRRYDYIEVRVPKLLSYPILPDNDQVDTVTVNRTALLSVFIRLNRTNSMEKYKIIAISKAGATPTFLPLSERVAWWAELGADWKKALMKTCKMELYPRESDLENLLAIRKLSLAKAPIKDAAPIAWFTDLIELDCSQTEISDLSPLKGLFQLESLNISKTKVNSLKGLDSLSNLIRLDCSLLKLKDVTPLTNLVRLEELDFSDNEVTDLKPLAGLIELRKLNFNNNYITTLSPLAALVNLEQLRFGKNKVDGFTILPNFPNLVILDCYSTGLDSAEPLRSLVKLVRLNCGGNPITSLDPIENHRYMVELNVSLTRITNLNALRNFKQLEVLDFSSNTVPELGPVHDLDGLRVLKCHLTKVEVRDKDRFKKKHPGCEITYY